VAASRQCHLAQLPPVLILHVKRFTFAAGRPAKLADPLRYTTELEIRGEWVPRGCSGARYRLTSLVAHHGHALNVGHYTAFLRTTAPAAAPDAWIHADDASTLQVATATALAQQAYLLFYVRAD
jgi:ubiquitin carboxyl-terminal hydrolase 36/42